MPPRAEFCKGVHTPPLRKPWEQAVRMPRGEMEVPGWRGAWCKECWPVANRDNTNKLREGERKVRQARTTLPKSELDASLVTNYGRLADNPHGHPGLADAAGELERRGQVVGDGDVDAPLEDRIAAAASMLPELLGVADIMAMVARQRGLLE